MAFIMDRQTFADLEIFENKENKQSVFKFFDRAISLGGREELLDMFYRPLPNLKSIRERQELIGFLCRENVPISIDRHFLDFIETYLRTGNKPVKVTRINAWHKYLKYLIHPTNEYYIIQRGIRYVIEFLQERILEIIHADSSTSN